MNIVRLAAAAAFASFFVVGCAVNTDATPAEEMTGSETSELSAPKSAAELLLGKWEADTGSIYKIEFTKEKPNGIGGHTTGNIFHATVDTGIRCITTPCPSESELSGIYSLGKDGLTLEAFDKPAGWTIPFWGVYSGKVSKTALSMHKSDPAVAGTFHRAAKPAGEKCGTTTCGEGLVCCNPLMNICTKPGMVCIQ